MDKVRIGFVGVGGMGQCAHLRNYATLPDCEVAAIAELRPELARKVAVRYGVPRVYPDHHAMLDAEALDAVVRLGLLLVAHLGGPGQLGAHDAHGGIAGAGV